ncbi:MAG: glycosyltransferase family 4 protein [Rhizonema sp. PD38]|nr:glycosyltransferase family 4 protein [Rhizonema sp. PD38]
MKILISAYSCEPGKGSERGVGWNVAREVAKYHEVWVLTRPDESQEAIEAELALNPVPNLHFIYFTLPIWGGGWRWGSSGAMQIHYYLWQIQAYFVARRLHREIGFDLIHHVTFGNYWTPSFLSLLPIPFVWGPVGGGESAPLSFRSDFGLKGVVYETVRDIARTLGEQNPFVRLTAQRSSLVLVATQETATRLQKMGVKQLKFVSGQTGLSKEEIDQLKALTRKSSSPVRFLSIGRLLHWKGFHLGLQAFALAKLTDAEYWVIGDGSQRTRLELLAQKLGIAEKVKFLGNLSRQEVLRKLEECHVVVHPSLHDFSPTVCWEAIAAGCPVLCLDLGGPAMQITEQTGIKVPAVNPVQAVQDLAHAMQRLSTDHELRNWMGQARERGATAEFDWEVKGKLLIELYEEAVMPSTQSNQKILKQVTLKA